MYESTAGPDLESGSLAQRIAGFRSYTVAHPIIKEVDAELKRAILEPAGRSLVFLVGPTGVGKTTLLTRIARHFQETESQQDGRWPLIALEAPAPDSATFSWRDFYERALDRLEGEPQRKKSKRGLGRRLYSIAHLRRLFEHAVRQRRPRAVLIDEAQHLTKVASGRKLSDQMDSLKSLASLTGCVYVLVGTYELLPSRNLSAQLSRRSMDIHFRPTPHAMPRMSRRSSACSSAPNAPCRWTRGRSSSMIGSTTFEECTLAAWNPERLADEGSRSICHSRKIPSASGYVPTGVDV